MKLNQHVSLTVLQLLLAPLKSLLGLIAGIIRVTAQLAALVLQMTTPA